MLTAFLFLLFSLVAESQNRGGHETALVEDGAGKSVLVLCQAMHGQGWFISPLFLVTA